MTGRKSLFITFVSILILIIFVIILHFVGLLGTRSKNLNSQIPNEILKIINKPIYKDAIWGLRVADLETGEVIYDFKPDTLFLTGSVRKLFSVGLALNELGEDHRFITPVHRQGQVDENGVLNGNLILVASGDLTMDGRRTLEDKMAIVNLDHNEANSLGNAELTTTDPLAGYDKLAKQVVGSGITKINGDVIIDDRLFMPFKFRGEFDVRPIFVNDDVVDVIINPTLPGEPASVDWRPKSAAFGVKSGLLTVAQGKEKDIELNPEFPSCFGKDNCLGTVMGHLPIGFAPPLTNKFPLIQTFRVVEPSAYARTVFIEALKRAGVLVDTNLIGPNPSEKLPWENSSTPDTLVAKLVSLPYSEYTRLILKVSYNIGADVSLLLFGLTQGVNNIKGALEVEGKTLVDNFGIPGDEFHFVDGSGGGESAATTKATLKLLKEMSETKVFTPFFESLPVLGVDGSLSFVTDFEDDPSLAGAKGNVHAKTGTFAQGTAQGVLFRAETLAGYINARGGRRLMFALYVNEVGIINSIDEILEVFQDQGTISAIIWREN